jgi:hypothetical protein
MRRRLRKRGLKTAGRYKGLATALVSRAAFEEIGGGALSPD